MLTKIVLDFCPLIFTQQKGRKEKEETRENVANGGTFPRSTDCLLKYQVSIHGLDNIYFLTNPLLNPKHKDGQKRMEKVGF